MSRFPAGARALLIVLSLAVAGVASADKDPVYTGLFSKLALKGYDAVAYFTEGKPVKGNSDYSVKYNGATWRFDSPEHRDLFNAAPEKYAPQFGGYCAWAVSQGYTASGDPEVWAVVDGKLYLNYDATVGRTWSADRDTYIELGNANWPKVLSD